MNNDVTEAVRLGQLKCLRCRDTYQQECLELAVDELLRNPDSRGMPEKLLDNALAHARNHLRRRRRIRHLVLASDQIAELGIGGGEHLDVERRLVIEFDDWIRRSPLRREQRALLLTQVHEVEVAEVARMMALPSLRVRERLSRARAVAREHWRAA